MLKDDFEEDLEVVFGAKAGKMTPAARRLLLDFWRIAKRRGQRNQKETLAKTILEQQQRIPYQSDGG